MNIKEQQKELAGFTAGILRKHFGKGPESVFVSISEEIVCIYVRDLLTPVERVLLEREQYAMVYDTRDTLMDKCLPELKIQIEKWTGREYQHFFYDWDIETNGGVIVATRETIIALEQEEFPQKINELVSMVTESIQKLPNTVKTVTMNNRTLVIYRDGILVDIEKEIYKLDQTEILRRAKSNLEKQALRKAFDKESHLLEGVVQEVFADWEFETDRSIIVVIIDPN
nr:Na-translocating system protein MpsC family protein [Terribacillus saccharophilus]